MFPPHARLMSTPFGGVAGFVWMLRKSRSYGRSIYNDLDVGLAQKMFRTLQSASRLCQTAVRHLLTMTYVRPQLMRY
jgi:hypothetical protein